MSARILTGEVPLGQACQDNHFDLTEHLYKCAGIFLDSPDAISIIILL